MKLYNNECLGYSSRHDLANAQNNLIGRTHYVDNETLRWHKSRIILARSTHDGLLFYIVESCAADMNNTKRGFRYVIFDIFGNVVGTRAKLADMWRSSKAAEKAMWADMNTLDSIAITHGAIERAEHYHAQEMAQIRTTLDKIQQSKAA